MRISRLKIQGFRTVNRGFDCTLNDLAIFVGRNNAGKSCAVRALDLFFNHSKKPDSFIPHIRVNPSSDKKTRYSIIIGVWVDDVSQSIRRKYRPYMNKEGQLPIRLYYSPKDGSVVYSGFRAGKFSTTKSNGDKLESIIDDINEQLSLRVIPETRDLDREFRTELGHGFKKLKNAVLAAAEGRATKKVKDYKEFVESIINKELVNKINKNLGEIIPDHEILMGDLECSVFSRMVLESLIDKLPISAKSDDSDDVSIEQMGAGFQSAVLVSLYRTVAQLEDKHLILCVEEPEIHLDSHSQRYCYHHWSQQVKEENDLNQVFITSHSAFLIDEATPEQIVLVKRDGDSCTATSQLSHNFLDTTDLDKLTTKTLGLNNTDLFFSSFILLVEGDGDMVAFRGFLDMLLKHKKSKSQSLAIAGISVIDCGGKDGIRALADFIKELDIPYAAVFDRDVIQQAKSKSDFPKLDGRRIEKTYNREISNDFKNQVPLFPSEAELKRVQVKLEAKFRPGIQAGFPESINKVLGEHNVFMMRTEHESDIIDLKNYRVISEMFEYDLSSLDDGSKTEIDIISELKAYYGKELKKAFHTSKLVGNTEVWSDVPHIYATMCQEIYKKMESYGVRI